MARVRTGSVGRLVLGVSPGVDATMLRALLAAVAKRKGSPEVEPRQVTSAEGLLGLARNELDAVIVHAVPAEAGVSHIVLAEDELGVALPSGHRLARQRTVAPAKLNGEPLVWMRRRWEPALYDDVSESLSTVGFVAGAPRGNSQRRDVVEPCRCRIGHFVQDGARSGQGTPCRRRVASVRRRHCHRSYHVGMASGRQSTTVSRAGAGRPSTGLTGGTDTALECRWSCAHR